MVLGALTCVVLGALTRNNNKRNGSFYTKSLEYRSELLCYYDVF